MRSLCDTDLQHCWSTAGGERRYTCRMCGADVVGVLDRAILRLSEATSESKVLDRVLVKDILDAMAVLADSPGHPLCGCKTCSPEETCQRIDRETEKAEDALMRAWNDYTKRNGKSLERG